MPLPAHLARKLAHQRAEQSVEVSASVEPDVVSTFDFNATPAPAVVPVSPEPVQVSRAEPTSCCANGTCTNGTCTENCCCKPAEPEVENDEEKKNNS